jgi:hypothetical protein
MRSVMVADLPSWADEAHSRPLQRPGVANQFLLVEIIRRMEAVWAVHAVGHLLLRYQKLDDASRIPEYCYFWLGVVHCVTPCIGIFRPESYWERKVVAG